MKLRVLMGALDAPLLLGPFAQVRSAAGMLYGDERCLNVYLPGRNPSTQAGCHELTMLPVEPA